jgi:hypothetical protein
LEGWSHDRNYEQETTMNCKQLCLKLFLVLSGIGFASAYAAAQAVLSPTLVTKAKEFKDIDTRYRQAVCNGEQSTRDQSKGVRDYLQIEIQKLIANEVTSSALVQKALDAASAAGDAADKIANTIGSSDQEKSAAETKFQVAKKELHDIAAREKAYIESELSRSYGVSFAQLDNCPDRPKSAVREVEQPRKPTRRAERRQARASGQRAAPAAATAAAPAFTPSVNIGGGSSSFSLSGSGGSITFGR